MEYLFHPLSFSEYVFLGLKWVPCKQHIYGSCLCIHLAHLCLLAGTFSSILTFKEIIYIYNYHFYFLNCFVFVFVALFLPLRLFLREISLEFVVKLVWLC